jgi:hypothetical protein
MDAAKSTVSIVSWLTWHRALWNGRNDSVKKKQKDKAANKECSQSPWRLSPLSIQRRS